MLHRIEKKKEESIARVGKIYTFNFRTGCQDTIDAIGYRMSQMLHFLCSDTKTDTVQYIVFVQVGSVCTREQINLHGLKQAERQAWLKNCGCKWWVAGLKGH